MVVLSWRSPSQRGVTPQGRGRFPGFDVLAEVDHWDDVTAGVVLARLGPTTDLSFFTVAEDAVARPLFDVLLAQDGEPRVPVVALVDARLAADETDGWRHDDMPPDPDAFRQTFVALDADARAAHDVVFAMLSPLQQARLVAAVDQASQDDEQWHGLPAKHVWSLWTRYACTAFYSHPWAWNEIGFGGPAYPRGYSNTGVDARERWEVADPDGADPVPHGQRVELALTRRQALVEEDE